LKPSSAIRLAWQGSVPKVRWTTAVCIFVLTSASATAQHLPNVEIGWFAQVIRPPATNGRRRVVVVRPLRNGSPTSLELRRLLADVRPGKYVFNPPGRMHLGQTEDVEFRVGEKETQALVADLKGRGEAIIGDIDIGTFMTAKLIGDPRDFAITNFSTERQFVAETARWQWKVTPVRSGKHSLRLLSTIRIKVPNSEEERDYLVKDEEIEIPVDRFYELKQFLTANGSWVWPFLLGGVAIEWWWRVLKGVATKFKGRNSVAPPPSP
jgi:hypothetical protein